MKIVSLKYKPFRRSFRMPFLTSKGDITERCGWIIRITGEDGTNGFGEAGGSLFTADLKERAINILKRVSDAIEGIEIPDSPPAVNETMSGVDTEANSTILFGIETALCDLAARAARKPLCIWLGEKYRDEIPVNYLISGPVDDWGEVKDNIDTRGYSAVKMKVGSRSIEDDVESIGRLRDNLGPDMAIRLDANRGWAFDQAVEALSRLKRFDVEYIEEPLDKYNPGRLKALRKVTGIKMALDESLAEIDDINAALSGERLCDIIILKPAVVGGIISTIELYNLARSGGYRVVITSNLETEIGIAAQLHMAAALSGELLPCGLDTLRLFVATEVSWSKVANGRIKLPGGHGAGVGEEIWKNLR